MRIADTELSEKISLGPICFTFFQNYCGAPDRTDIYVSPIQSTNSRICALRRSRVDPNGKQFLS